jgi:adenylate cyclase
LPVLSGLIGANLLAAEGRMAEIRKLAVILCSDIVGFSRLAGADEDRTLARFRALRSDLIDPTVAVHNGRVVKRTGDGAIIEFRSVVDAVRCAIEVQHAMVERNAGVAEDRRIVFRIGIHLGDVVEESDGDLMGDGVNIAARLEAIAKPGTICLSEDAYRQVKGRLDLAVTELGPTKLKNIAEPVRVYLLQVGMPGVAARAGPREFRKRLTFAAGIGALVAVAGGTWYFLVGHHLAPVVAPVPAEVAHLSLVVLPFTNLSSDPSQDYFADGVTENLTTDLSRIRNSFVIARNTAFTFKGKAVDAKEIGKELGVRYVLEGSVQRDQNRVRVNAQLIDAQSGAHLWADRFEEGIADLFKLQDQVVARLANTLGYELVKAEAEKASRAKNPDVVGLVMHGWALMWQATQHPAKEKQEDNNAARALFDQALKIDATEADALSGDAYTYFVENFYALIPTTTDYDAMILGQVDRAIASAPDNVRAYYVKAQYLFTSRRPSEALGAANAGLDINPNYALLYSARSGAELSLGQFAQAKSDAQRALRLSPRDPYIGLWHLQTGDAELGMKNFNAAIAEYQIAIDSGFRVFYAYTNLSAAYALEDRMDEAKSALAEGRRLNPKITVKWMIAHTPNIPTIFEGVRKAGLPEE